DHMSMVFQDPMSHLSPVFTIGEMMADVLHYHDRADASWWDILATTVSRDRRSRSRAYREEAIAMLERLQIPDPTGIMDRYPNELSGGMRQRVLIAMALLNEPDFLVADEPTTALDVTVQEQILELLESRIVEEGLSMLYITHNLGVARKLADRIYVMYAGTIAETGQTQEVFDNPLHPYSRGLIESIPKLTGFGSSGIPGGIPDYTQPPRGCRFYPRCPAYMQGTCNEAPPDGFAVDGRQVHCYLYENEPDLETAIEIAEEEVEYPAYGSAIDETRTDDVPAGRGTGGGS
ncbi:MAG: ABC transporter ATP-binding protein, partial [Halobacteriota archaeon]